MPMRPPQFHPRHAIRGASLIEVLVAVLIMGIGLLGIAALQTTALRNSQGSLERSQAVMQTYAILDAMRANRPAAISDNYDMAMCTPPNTVDLAGTDRTQWLGALRTTINPSACGQISCVVNNCTVTVQWNDSRAANAASANGTVAGGAAYQVRTQTLL